MHEDYPKPYVKLGKITFKLNITKPKTIFAEIKHQNGPKVLVSPLKTVLALCKSIFHPKRPDFDGIGQTSTYKDIFSSSQRFF